MRTPWEDFLLLEMSWKKLVNLISLLILEEGLGKIGLKEVGATARMLKIQISDENNLLIFL